MARYSSASRNMKDPSDQIVSHMEHPSHLVKAGYIYLNSRTIVDKNGVLQQHFKAGFAENVGRRRKDYARKCVGVHFDWQYCWPVSDVRRVERMIHNAFEVLGSHAVCVKCPGCGVRHREFYSKDFIPTVERAIYIIEFVIELAGLPVDRLRACVGRLAPVLRPPQWYNFRPVADGDMRLAVFSSGSSFDAHDPVRRPISRTGLTAQLYRQLVTSLCHARTLCSGQDYAKTLSNRASNDSKSPLVLQGCVL
ncbi:hypothetical protein C8R43DRAFT_1103060 [Mycena crocata]|nr:hypothetical protein C8R43DRAFT_1103060 [Mycena crocata]